MGDPRAEALLRAISGGQEAPPTEMEPMANDGTPSTPEEAAGAAMQLLEPFMEDPRIAEVAQMLQGLTAPPPEMPEESAPEEAGMPVPEAGY